MRQKELRIALVCYGGVSLAIYMHGVTKELWKLARASRAFHGGERPHGGTEAIYLKLLERIRDLHALKLRVLPDIIAGEKIVAVAVTEPDAGSDVKGIRTTARREGDHYVLNGAKMFITNGVHADLYCVAAKTDPQARPSQSVSIFRRYSGAVSSLIAWLRIRLPARARPWCAG